MFHLYFGAFDVVMYLGGGYAAWVLADAICDRMDAADAAQVKTRDGTPELAPMQPIDPSLTAPVKKTEETTVKVSLK
jgi:hypothetical protein